MMMTGALYMNQSILNKQMRALFQKTVAHLLHFQSSPTIGS